jgi:organic hydroperoxide reductase OsmC/OhrA
VKDIVADNRGKMMSNDQEHSYSISVRWTGNLGQGTANYRAYKRDHEISAPGKPPVPGSSDPNFRGDKTRYNPEELLVASLSTCHMLWYLHLCSEAGLVITDYQDEAAGTMVETKDGGGRFTRVTLHPVVTFAASVDTELALRLHDRAHHLCFIANSVNFPVLCEPSIKV